MGCIVNTYDTLQSRDPNAAAFPRQLPACLPAFFERGPRTPRQRSTVSWAGRCPDFRCADSVVLFVDRTRQTGRTRRSIVLLVGGIIFGRFAGWGWLSSFFPLLVVLGSVRCGAVGGARSLARLRMLRSLPALPLFSISLHRSRIKAAQSDGKVAAAPPRWQRRSR
ncbi:hypothetical protein JOL62DRAFT_103314 [Phyllosticta paracitricarpa]|uniref:Uncharacterized protein n=1 Tax=Phyllosticta paracitricarpa TaxID=2016321 RepID=A0ABR1N759_9PEZI